MVNDERAGLIDDDEDEATKISKIVRPPPPPPGAFQTGSVVIVAIPSEAASAASDLGRRIRIEKVLSIGRHSSNGLVLDQDDVSRRHAQIELVGDEFVLRDLGSRNGTLLNDVLFRGAERALTDGDRIQVGPTHLKFIQSETEEKFHEVIYKLKVEDALTRIHNKRFLVEFLEREVARATRHKTPLSLTLFDIDHFKRINDTWGHLAGDAVLRELAALVKPLARVEDCFARYGGEEFAFVQPAVGIAGASTVAEKIRASVEAYAFVWEGTRLPVTVSLGVCEFDGSMSDYTQFIRLSDERLYEAKRGGRNRVVASPSVAADAG